MQKLKKYRNKKIFSYVLFFLLSISYKNILVALDLEGNFIQGGLAYGKVEEDVKVFFNSENVPVYKDGSFVIGFSRNNENVSLIKLIYQNNEILEKYIKIKKRKYKIQKINNLDKEKVEPPKSYYDRIKEEVLLVRKAKKKLYNFPYYKAGFMMPVEGIITGVYGSQRILNGIPRRPHYGIDIANKKGTIILSPSDGVIVLAENDLYFSGGTIVISHGMGITSSLLHLSKLEVEVGDKVKKGQRVGLMGSTGRSTGPHLDWRMEVNGVRIDPNIVLSLENNIM